MADDPNEKPAPPPAPPEMKEGAAATTSAASSGAAARPAAPAKPAVPPKPKGPVPTDVSDRPFLKELAAAVPDAFLSAKEFLGQTTVELKPTGLVEACRFLKGRSFTYLVDLTAVDWKARAPRFDLVYWLHSFDRGNERLRVRVGIGEGEACPTLNEVFRTANWMEREVYDLFGVTFSGHPDLRRILTWDGFQGHPLRKDFPVEGIDTGAAIYPDRFPEGGGPSADDSNRKVVS